MNENDQKTQERLTRRRRTDRKPLLREEQTDAELVLSGFRKTISWASVILVPVASIIGFYNLLLSKIQKIISDETRVQESRIQRIEHDNDKQDERIRELEKRER